MNMLPAGKYWIGDPCYVLSNDDTKFDWGDFCSSCFENDPSGRSNEGIVTHQGITFAHYGTAYGDGCYEDNQGNEYGVDAGMLGCIPIDSVIDKSGLDSGTVHEFPEAFTTDYDEGKIRFGHVIIDTDPEYDEEYEEDENWDEGFGDD